MRDESQRERRRKFGTEKKQRELIWGINDEFSGAGSRRRGREEGGHGTGNPRDRVRVLRRDRDSLRERACCDRTHPTPKPK